MDSIYTFRRSRRIQDRQGRLTDPKRFQCWGVDLTGSGQRVDRLKPANRFCRLWADYAIDRTLIVTELIQQLLHGNNLVPRKRHFGWRGLVIGIVATTIVIIVASIVVIIAVVRIVEPVVGVIIRKGIYNKKVSVKMIPEPEMIFVPEMILETISVPRKALSLMFCEATAGKTVPGEPSEMAAATDETATVTNEMAAATDETATATNETATATTETAAATTMCERGGSRERHNAAPNQTNQ